MDCIESGAFSPGLWCVDRVPEVDDVRPMRCSACRAPARGGGRITLHGHGWRTREVVVMPAFDACSEIVECWARRYRCTACHAVAVVLPRGVVPRYLYSTAAIVMALFLVEEAPVGDGHTDADAYARQGMYRRTSWSEASPYRWRSLDRWSWMAARWWPNQATDGVTALLVSWLERSGGLGRAQAVLAAVCMHVQWGEAM